MSESFTDTDTDSDSDSDSDDSLEFYDAVSDFTSEGKAGLFSMAKAIEDEKDDDSVDDHDEEKDVFVPDHETVYAERNRSRSTNDVIPNPSSKESPKLGFASSIRSLFGGLSNFDVDDLDAEESEEEKGDMRTLSRELREVADEEQSGRGRGLSSDSFSTEVSQLQIPKQQDQHNVKQKGGSQKDATSSSTSFGTSIWNFFSSIGGSKSSSSQSDDRGKDRDKTEKKIGVKLSLIGKKRATYRQLSVMQELEEHHGHVWVMRFSRAGTFLASGGQDGKAVVWSVGKDRRASCLVEVDDEEDSDERSPAPSAFALGSPAGINSEGVRGGKIDAEHETGGAFIFPLPCRVFADHDGHIVDLSWSPNDFLLTACLDKVVRLWHVKSPACLQQFKHNDLISSLDFHPSDDRFFVTGCFDKVLRLWDTTKGAEPMKFKEAQDMITSVAFTPDGSRVAVGLFRGQVFFYKTDDLKIETQIVCTKSSKKRRIKYGFKVTGLVFRTISENHHHDGESVAYELLVTTSDSSIRLYQVKDLSLTTKFKGLVNKSKPIRASFSNHGHHIICGSDTTGVFIWKVPKRRHLESKREKHKHAERDKAKSQGGEEDVVGDDEDDVENKVKETDDHMRARFESMYYSKKYKVYKKYEKLTCEANFKNVCTTVALFAPPAALREGAMHLQPLLSGRAEGKDDENDERLKPFNTVIFEAEMNGTIRIIKAKSSHLL